MGTYVNPGNQAFKRISGPNYVDKTELISLMNNRVGGDDALCVSADRVGLASLMLQKCLQRTMIVHVIHIHYLMIR